MVQKEEIINNNNTYHLNDQNEELKVKIKVLEYNKANSIVIQIFVGELEESSGFPYINLKLEENAFLI